jgi:hypothetical protein
VRHLPDLASSIHELLYGHVGRVVGYREAGAARAIVFDVLERDCLVLLKLVEC